MITTEGPMPKIKLDELTIGTPLRVIWRDAASTDDWLFITEVRSSRLEVITVGLFHSVDEEALLLMQSRGSHDMGCGWMTIPTALIEKWEMLHAV